LKVLGDAPAEKDELGRGSYVQALAKVIMSADTPLVIAVYGAWGTGKTSLMKQLKGNLELSRSSGLLAGTVWFDPWMHQSDETPILGLLHETAAQLHQLRKQQVKDALVNIGRAIATDLTVPYVGLRMGRVLEEVARGVYEQRTQQAQLFKYFQAVLDAAGRKKGRLVFFIDDLDRCRPRTALRMLEALHLFLNFENCIFVLGLDREPIEAAIAAEYGDLGLRVESFLDKIIQLPFAIPTITEPVLNSFVASRVSNELEDCRPILIAAAPDDPRQLKRTINVLLFSHSLVDRASFRQGYDPRILTVIVLIQNLAPSLYQILRMRPTAIGELLPTRNQDSSLDPTDSVTQIEASDLWVKYIASAPSLAQALRLVPIADDLDIRPYLNLTATVASEGIGPPHRGRMLLSSILSVDKRNLERILAPVLRSSAPAARQAELAAMIEEVIAQSLNVDLSDLILAGWNEHRDLMSVARRTSGDSALSELFTSGLQRVQTTFEPPVELAVDGILIASLHATLNVICEMAPMLLVRNGLIVQVEGETDVSVQLMLQDEEVAAAQRRLKLSDVFEADLSRGGISLHN